MSITGPAVFADGGCVGSNPSEIGGTWAWCAVDAAGRRTWAEGGLLLVKYLPNQEPLDYSPEIAFWGCTTNNLMEFLALLKALEFLPEQWRGTVCSDSMVTLGRFFAGAGPRFKLPLGVTRMGGNGAWKLKNIPSRWAQRMERAVTRLGPCEIVLLDGHPTRAQLAAGVGKRGQPVSEHNVFCDTECTRIGREYRELGILPER